MGLRADIVGIPLEQRFTHDQLQSKRLEGYCLESFIHPTKASCSVRARSLRRRYRASIRSVPSFQDIFLGA